MACPSYPDCRSTLSMPSDEAPKLAGKCPECGAAMTVRKSKHGKVYYSCSGYPDCKFMSWDVPTGDKCPDCNAALVKSGRNGVRCSNKDCSYKVKTPVKAKFQTDEDFAPPLLDEPIYFDYDDENAGYFPPDYEE